MRVIDIDTVIRDVEMRSQKWRTVGYRVGAIFGSAVTLRLYIQVRHKQALQPGHIKWHTPCSPVHWTLLFRCHSPYPLEQTVHIKYMIAFLPNCHQRYVSQFLTGCIQKSKPLNWADSHRQAFYNPGNSPHMTVCKCRKRRRHRLVIAGLFQYPSAMLRLRASASLWLSSWWFGTKKRFELSFQPWAYIPESAREQVQT